MANEWFRLWHDMPTDPKWKTIARASGQPISVVIAVAMHYMASASRNVTRGHVDVTVEDVASALDVTDDVVDAIYKAMQGRFLDGNRIISWEKRQPKKEDAGSSESGAKSAAERKREQRERERLAAESAVSRASHDESREVTTDKDKEEDKDKDKDKEEKQHLPTPRKRGKSAVAPGLTVVDLRAKGVSPDVATEFLAIRSRKRAPLTELALAGIEREADKAGLSLDAALRKCVERGWQGFDAGWVQNQARAFPGHQSNAQRIADWNAELRDVLNEGQRPMVIDMGVIDASR
ncbi:hypothetical protein ACOTI8_30535 [Achromobacter xylosoxidans]